MPVRRICRALAAALFALMLLAPGAHASGLTASCDGQELERPFLPWADPAQYVLAPDGALDHGADGWELDNAGVVADNEPFEVRGPAEPAALHIGPGGSATSPAMCVTLAHPTLRFFARNAGDVRGTLAVEVLFEDPLGRVRSLPIGLAGGAGQWSPTAPMPIVANLLALLPGGRTPVAFRFTPVGEGSEWMLDDVYVDPYCKG